MKRLLALLPVVLLASACSTSSGGTAVSTVTKTVTATATVTATPAVGAGTVGVGTVAAGTDSPAPSSTAGGEAPDACSLLTQSEADKVAGTPLMKPVGAGTDSAGHAVMCQFVGLTTGPTAELEVYVGDGAAQQLHIERDNLKHTFTAVPGVGDQCLQEDGYIFVEKNGLWASIHLVRLNDPKQNVAPMQVGIKQLAARLP